jgi:hypothetical protein
VKTFVLNPIETQNKDDSVLRTHYAKQLTTFLKKHSINAQIIA